LQKSGGPCIYSAVGRRSRSVIRYIFSGAYTPWTKGQRERMNRTIKEATAKRYHYDSHNQLKACLDDFAKRLKSLAELTVHEFICKCWQNEPHRFALDQIHQMPGLKI
jgi:16S rRNA C1402 (ribose-2'-O) methylase RsmI